MTIGKSVKALENVCKKKKKTRYDHTKKNKKCEDKYVISYQHICHKMYAKIPTLDHPLF